MADVRNPAGISPLATIAEVPLAQAPRQMVPLGVGFLCARHSVHGFQEHPLALAHVGAVLRFVAHLGEISDCKVRILRALGPYCFLAFRGFQHDHRRLLSVLSDFLRHLHSLFEAKL